MPKRRQPAAAAADDRKRPRADAALVPAPRMQAFECEICNESLETSEAAGGDAAADALSSRLPRLLPCGHSCCTSCIQKDLNLHGGQLKCLLCDFDPKQRLDSALTLPKNFALIKMIDERADRDAMAELAALPCQQCDPMQPRQPAKVHCNDCGANYGKQHDVDAHTVAPLSSHKRVSVAAHAAELSAAATAKKDAAFAAAAAASRLAAKAEEQKIEQVFKSAKERQEARRRELDSIGKEVDVTVKALQDGADRLRSDFQQHRQSVQQAARQLADRAAALAPLRQIARHVQQADDFDANLQFAQLQHDCQSLHAEVAQAIQDTRRCFDVDAIRMVAVSLSLSHLARQSLILSGELIPKLAPFCTKLKFKAEAGLLYRGSRDGFKTGDFVRCCANKGSTLTLVKVAGNNFVFGAYTHYSWPAVESTVADPTGKSFLFSLVNKTGKAVRFSLRDRDRAIQLTESIFFGTFKCEGDKPTGYPNVILMYKGAADQKGANTANHPKDHNTPYQADDDDACDAFFLAGQILFTAAEIEVFSL